MKVEYFNKCDSFLSLIPLKSDYINSLSNIDKEYKYYLVKEDYDSSAIKKLKYNKETKIDYKKLNKKEKANLISYYFVCDLYNTSYNFGNEISCYLNNYINYLEDIKQYISIEKYVRLIDYYTNIEKYNFDRSKISDILDLLRSKFNKVPCISTKKAYVVKKNNHLLLSNNIGRINNKIEVFFFLNKFGKLLEEERFISTLSKYTNLPINKKDDYFSYLEVYYIFNNIQELDKWDEVEVNLMIIDKYIDNLHSDSNVVYMFGFIISYFCSIGYNEYYPFLNNYIKKYCI